MLVSRANIKRPTLPKETVDAPALGGEVVVRGLLLSERMDLLTAESNRYEIIAKALSSCVLADDGKPYMNFEDWQVFGGQHIDEAAQLFEVVKRLSGLGGNEDAKKDDSTQS